jgi:hypothetical protein
MPIVAHLEKTGVKYCLSGSLAATFYGTCQSLADVELVAELSPAHVLPLIDAIRPAYWTDQALICDAVATKSCFSVVHLPTTMTVVVHISKTRPYDRAMMSRIRRDTFDDGSASTGFYLPSPEDVVLSKLEWYRLGDEVSERQWRDVIGVMKVSGTALDRPCLDRWAAELGVADLLAKAWTEAEANGP